MSIYSKRIYTPKRSYRTMNKERAKEIQNKYFSGIKQTELASMYGVSQSTIARAISGESWA